MDAFLIVVFVVVFLISALVFSRPRGLPPGPLSLPFFGSIFIMRQFTKKRPHLVLFEAAKKYGNIMSLKFGNRQIIVLTGYDVIHQALVKHSDVFSDRPNHLPQLKYLLRDGGGILFQSYNHHWRTMRRFTLQTLRDFGVGKSSIEEKIMVEIDAAAKVLQETGGQPLIVAPLLQNIIGNVIYGIIFGKRYAFDDPDFKMVRSLTNLILSGLGIGSPVNFFPMWFCKLMPSKMIKADLRRTMMGDRINAFMLEKIKEHEDSYDEANIRDFVDLYIKVSKENKEETKDTFTKGNMLRVIQDLFLAGSETTSTSLDWALLYMIEYPEVQRKCQQEIERVVGDKPVAYADRLKLPYTEATVMEIQRMSTIVPTAVIHCTSGDAELRGYKIPQGAVVIPLLYSVSFDTKYWDEPSQFDPERFLSYEGKIVKKEAQIPFSTGPRVCLGEPLARMELFLVFAHLLQRFTFHREDESVKHSMEPKNTQVTNAPLEYKLRATKR